MKDDLSMNVFGYLDLIGKVGIAKETGANEVEFLKSLSDSEVIVLINEFEKFEPKEVRDYIKRLFKNNSILIMKRVSSMNIPD